MSPCLIVLATRNSGKVREIRRALKGLPVSTSCAAEYGDIEEPPEDGDTFAENACAKAIYYARATGQWCLADDSGLVVDALDGRPGVFSARYAADRCPPGTDRRTLDQAGNVKLLEEMEGVEDARRTGRFVCRLALADTKRVLIESEGVIDGLIARRARGDNGFGYDPVFYLPELGCTVAQLTTERKNQISHRGQAVRQFVGHLRELLGSAPRES